MSHMREEYSRQWNNKYKDSKAGHIPDPYEEGPRHRREEGQVMEAPGEEFGFYSKSSW